jgi:hypothetical protein
MKNVRWTRAIGLAVITLTLTLALAAQEGDQPGLPGKYTQEGTVAYLVLTRSFGFIQHTQGERRPRTGHYTVDGKTLTLIGGVDGQSTLFTVQGEKLYDPDGTAWVKQGTAASATEPPNQTDAVRDNEQIAVLNSLIVQSREAMNSTPPDYDKAASLMLHATSVRPKEGLLWLTLGDADFGAKKYKDAINAYKNAIERNAASKAPNPEIEAKAKKMIDQLLVNGGNNLESALTSEQVPTATAPIEPPPPPPDAAPPAPKTISLGQTPTQVSAILGPPQKIAHLGAKEIDYYPDMKVVFVNGKVTDIQ